MRINWRKSSGWLKQRLSKVGESIVETILTALFWKLVAIALLFGVAILNLGTLQEWAHAHISSEIPAPQQTGVEFQVDNNGVLTVGDAMKIARRDYRIAIDDSGLEDVVLPHGSIGRGRDAQEAIVSFLNSYGKCFKAQIVGESVVVKLSSEGRLKRVDGRATCP